MSKSWHFTSQPKTGTEICETTNVYQISALTFFVSAGKGC